MPGTGVRHALLIEYAISIIKMIPTRARVAGLTVPSAGANTDDPSILYRAGAVYAIVVIRAILILHADGALKVIPGRTLSTVWRLIPRIAGADYSPA